MLPGRRGADTCSWHPWVSLVICLLGSHKTQAPEDWRTGWKTGGILRPLLPLQAVLTAVAVFCGVISTCLHCPFCSPCSSVAPPGPHVVGAPPLWKPCSFNLLDKHRVPTCAEMLSTDATWTASPITTGVLPLKTPITKCGLWPPHSLPPKLQF